MHETHGAARTTGSAQPLLDDEFLDRAFKDADLNALRMALFQATGDPSLAAMKVDVVLTRGATLAPEHHDEIRSRVKAFLRAGPRDAGRPDDTRLRRLMEAMTGQAVSDKEFAYRRDMLAFDDFPRAASWTGAKPKLPEGFSVAIVGAGFSGIAAAIQFQRLGIPFTVYERRHEPGGTWSINTYPDARVDTDNFVYQYSFEKNYPWSEYFCRQNEVRGYIEHVARKFGVFENIRFNCDLASARFDAASGTWALKVSERGGKPFDAVANVVIAASGLFGVPKILDVPGMESFAGQVVHSTQWNGDISLKGRSVAIVGNGSTGVQLLSKVASEAKRVTVFQRTPQWISPRDRYGAPISRETRWLLDNMPHYWNWYVYSTLFRRMGAQDMQEIDPEWQRSGGQISRANDAFRATLENYIRSKLGSRPELIDKVTPRYAPFVRRLIVDNGWYDALLRDNVELVTEGIAAMGPQGLRTASGAEVPIDLLISATGFQTSRYVWPTRLYGLGGVELHDFWESEGGSRAHLGTTVPGFPNLFILYGPNSQPRGGSLPGWFETWARYAAQVVVGMLEGGQRWLTVRREVYDRYNADMDKAAEGIVWTSDPSDRHNYYLDKSGRSSVNAPWRGEDLYGFYFPLRLDEFRAE